MVKATSAAHRAPVWAPKDGFVSLIGWLTAFMSNSTGLSIYRWPLTAWCTILREGVQRAIFFPWLSTKYRANITGLVNLDQLEGSALFAINHNAIQWDSLVLLKCLPRRRRRLIAYASAAEITFGKRWLGVLASVVANAFPFSRDTAIRQSLEHLGGLLDEGWSIGSFPKGNRESAKRCYLSRVA